MRRRSRPSPALRLAVRSGAGAALGAALLLPLARRRLRIPAPLTIAACALGPPALAVLRPRSKRRDVALFALQMWAFTVVHEIPFDHPERLRRRLSVRYPIAIDRALGAGRLPNARLQGLLGRVGRVGDQPILTGCTGSGSWSPTWRLPWSSRATASAFRARLDS